MRAAIEKAVMGAPQVLVTALTGRSYWEGSDVIKAFEKYGEGLLRLLWVLFSSQNCMRFTPVFLLLLTLEDVLGMWVHGVGFSFFLHTTTN